MEGARELEGARGTLAVIVNDGQSLYVWLLLFVVLHSFIRAVCFSLEIDLGSSSWMLLC